MLPPTPWMATIVAGEQAVGIGADDDEVAGDWSASCTLMVAGMRRADHESGGSAGGSGPQGIAQAEAVVVDAVDDPAAVRVARGHNAANVDAVAVLKSVAGRGDHDGRAWW